MRNVLSLLLAGVLVAGCAASRRPARAPAPAPAPAFGPAVGATIPDLRFRDATGADRTLGSMMGRRGAFVLFFRSADWWPFCRTQLVELQGHLEEIQRDGYSLVAISPDSPEILAAFAREHAITFPLLSDPRGTAVAQIGLINREIKPDDAHFGIPYPGTLVIDAQRVVVNRFFEDGYRDRRTASSELFVLQERLAPPPTAAASSANGLTLHAWSTDERVAPGTVFTLVLEGVPGPGMHVYGPAVTHYRAISLTFHPPAGLIVDAPHFPATETWRFEPLHEVVDVYRSPFRITSDAHIEVSKESLAAIAGKTGLDIEATLDWQACSDRECFVPQSAPIHWEVSLLPLLRWVLTENQKDTDRYWNAIVGNGGTESQCGWC